jgi:hypothetical protein
MTHSVVARLYFDPYSGLDGLSDEAIIVTDAKSYAAARQAIEAAKAGEIALPLTIVVRSKHFAAGFHDLALLRDLVEITHISPRHDIAGAFGFQLPDNLTDQDLIALGVRNHADLLAVVDSGKIRDFGAFNDALLVKAFQSNVFQSVAQASFDTWFVRAVGLFYSEQTPSSKAWTIDYVRRLVSDRIESVLECFGRTDLLPFIRDLWHRCERGEARPYLDQLAVRCWLGSYSKLARKAVVANLTDEVGSWQEIIGEATVLDALAPWCETLYEQADSPLCDQVERVLTLLFHEDGLIESEDPKEFIRQTSGRFEAEHTAATAQIVRMVLKPPSDTGRKQQRAAFSTYLAQLDSQFTPLVKRSGRSLTAANWIGLLLELSDVVDHLGVGNPSRWDDWLATYELLIRARALKGDLQDTVPTDQREHLADLAALFSALDERLNSAFAGLLTGASDHPRLVLHAARLALEAVAMGAKVVLLVLDALDWQLWRHLRSAFAKEGFVIEGDDAGVAMLPSITEFSRRAIFAGLSPSTLSRFVDDIYGTEVLPQEEAKTLARALGYLGRIDQLKPLRDSKHVQYLAGELVYASGGLRELRRALELDAKCYALVYSELDAHIHVSKLEEPGLRSSARQWLSDLVDQVVQGIRQNPSLRDQSNLKIIITSDHGFLNVSEQTQAELDRSLTAFLDLERHGRLAIVRVRDPDASASGVSVRQLVESFCSKHPAAWHVVWREQEEQYGLAGASPSEGEVVAWLMPRLLQYVSKGKGNYVHGGLSMYEMIVPLAVLTTGQLEVEAPAITLTGQLSSEEESLLSIAVLNNNNQPLREVVIEIPDLDLSGLHARDIGPGSVERLDVVITPAKSGEITVRVVLEGEIGGTRRRFLETRTLTVSPGRRERMRQSTRRTLSDEDSW